MFKIYMIVYQFYAEICFSSLFSQSEETQITAEEDPSECKEDGTKTE